MKTIYHFPYEVVKDSNGNAWLKEVLRDIVNFDTTPAEAFKCCACYSYWPSQCDCPENEDEARELNNALLSPRVKAEKELWDEFLKDNDASVTAFRIWLDSKRIGDV